MTDTTTEAVERLINTLDGASVYVENDDCIGGNVMREAISILRALAAERDTLKAELQQANRQVDAAWRRAEIAEAKVKGWESQVLLADLPILSVPVDSFGPAAGEQVYVPKIERITDILDQLAAERSMADMLAEDLECYREAIDPDCKDHCCQYARETEEVLAAYRKARGIA